ncbi:WD repeat-containing protein 34 [Merluccius polli]|uniref:WD repeat-containing protein 34 n=1 Tax=Merluccius polli TaxID=89951 RepID=A0AA47MVA5_MERPO|nr:WD repeat-containing protein 34 [Merluccius polli]
MFSDETLDCVGVESLWRKSQRLTQQSSRYGHMLNCKPRVESRGELNHVLSSFQRGCQTKAVTSAEAEVQTVVTTATSSQTQPQDQLAEHLLTHLSLQEAEPPGLQDFLGRVEAMVIRELAKNAKSHAFDGFQVNWEDRSQSVSRRAVLDPTHMGHFLELFSQMYDLFSYNVSCLHCLQDPSAQEKGLHVTSMSWNCTGSVVAGAYGRIDDGDWSTEASYVCTWNVDRRGLNPKQADLTIDVSTAVMAISFHPTRPSLIAGGLYSGEVVVWDTSKSQDSVVAQTGMSAQSHREAVYQVAWVPLEKRGEFGVLSASSGGRVLLWTLDPDPGTLVLHAGYALITQQVPHSSSAHTKARGSSHVGITSLALAPWDPDTFLVGSEGGLLLKCSFSSQTPAAVPSSQDQDQDHSLALKAPAVFSFRPRRSPIHAIHCSPFHRNLFLSVGTDGLAHLHSLLQASPLLSLRVSDAYVFDVSWSPTRPLVFAAATGHGVVQIFDLGRRSARPVATIEHGSGGKAATCLAFNAANTDLLAVGNMDGTLNIWHLSSDLTKQGPREIAQLEQLANEVAE